ncbi:MAG: DUF86 domain-containing protein [Acidobacteria bacterium]|nr:DUF86 domain-containing protein [Acidobacteriota bacterium]
MTLDADVVRSRCAEIEEAVARLEQLAALPRDQFLADRDSQDIACYRLLVGIEAALTLCYHVTTRRLRKAPDDYAACFAILCEAGLVAPDLSERLQQMARFRNLLVHLYWKLDYGRVYDIMQGDIGDLRRFASAIAALV